jgi:hypothetical protein
VLAYKNKRKTKNNSRGALAGYLVAAVDRKKERRIVARFVTTVH